MLKLIGIFGVSFLLSCAKNI